MPLDAETTDLATLAFVRRKAMKTEAEKTNPCLFMAGESHTRSMAVLDLLSAATELMGDEPMRRLLRSYVAGTRVEMFSATGPDAEEVFVEAICAFEDAPSEIIDHFSELADAT